MRALITDCELRKLIIALDPSQKESQASTEDMAIRAAAYWFAHPPKKEFNQLNVLRKQVIYLLENGRLRTADAIGQ